MLLSSILAILTLLTKKHLSILKLATMISILPMLILETKKLIKMKINLPVLIVVPLTMII